MDVADVPDPTRRRIREPRMYSSQRAKCPRSTCPPSTFPTGTFGRGGSQPWTPASSPRMPYPLLCSPVRRPPAAARLTGGKTSAWHNRNKTNLSFPRCLKVQKLQSTYWLAGGRGLLGLQCGKKRCNSAARSPAGRPWPVVAGAGPAWSSSPGFAVPGEVHSPGRTGRPQRLGMHRGPEQMPSRPPALESSVRSSGARVSGSEGMRHHGVPAREAPERCRATSQPRRSSHSTRAPGGNRSPHWPPRRGE